MRILALFLLVILSVWIYSAFKYAWTRRGRHNFAVLLMLGFVMSAADFTFVVDNGLRILSQKIREKFKVV